ncbi:MAG: hypothetical protein ACRDHP_19910, partial [Ktedonobacterales bacterium]
VPQETQANLNKGSGAMPILTPKGATAYQKAQQMKSNAAAPHNAGIATIKSSTASANLPSTFNKFQGQSNSGTVCSYFGSGGCQPPDMGLAASPTGLALQSVNTSLSLYNLAGAVQAGWPKSAQNFFGVPAPLPANCDPGSNNQPFLSDPRSWFDPFDNRWGEAELQVEGGLGIAPSCNFVTKYWIATSKTSDPNGGWNIFAINMAFGSDPTAAADYTQFGYNGDGLYVSANMFGTGFYAEVVGCGPKSSIYAGASFACHGYYNLTVGSVVIDTVNPVQNPMSSDNSPTSEFFVSSFNSPDPFGNDCVSTACHGASIWSFSDPGSGSNIFTGAFVDTSKTYVEPPGADQPSCTGGAGCVESLDTRVSATPVYHAGAIWAAHVTGITNASSQFVPGIQWWQFSATLAPGYPTHITSATEVQDAYLNASNNYTALTFPVIMPDLDNDIIMGYDYMGDTVFPSINFTDRRVTDPLNSMTGGLGIIAVSGTVSTSNSRWGDFEAMSYPATYQDTIWFSSQYANPATSGDWITSIMRLHLAING